VFRSFVFSHRNHIFVCYPYYGHRDKANAANGGMVDEERGRTEVGGGPLFDQLIMYCGKPRRQRLGGKNAERTSPCGFGDSSRYIWFCMWNDPPLLCVGVCERGRSHSRYFLPPPAFESPHHLWIYGKTKPPLTSLTTRTGV